MQDRNRKRRSDKRVRDVSLNRKKASDAVAEEAIEEALDWLERGGFQRLWRVIKVIFGLLLLFLLIAFIYIIDST